MFRNERETLHKFASAELQTKLYKSGILVNVKGAILQLRVMTDTEEEVSPSTGERQRPAKFHKRADTRLFGLINKPGCRVTEPWLAAAKIT